MCVRARTADIDGLCKPDRAFVSGAHVQRASSLDEGRSANKPFKYEAQTALFKDRVRTAQ